MALLSPDFTHSSSSGGVTKQTFLSEAFPAEFDSEVFDGCLYWGAKHREVLNGENTFSFTVPGGQADAAYVAEGNLVAFKDLDNYWQFFEIKKLVDVHGDGLTRTAYCEHILYELIDDIVTDKRPTSTATAALAGMLDGTRWQVGIVDDLGSASASAYYISALEAVQKVANAWSGELRWRCVVEGGIITRYVDLVAMRGVDAGKQFVYSKDILSVEREVDISTVATALYGRGKGVELETGGFGRRLTFADIVAADKPAGQEWIGDDDALARWGRPGRRHRFDVFVDEDEEDAEKLLEKTRDELAKRKVPRLTYSMKVISLEELTHLGADISGEYFVQPEHPAEFVGRNGANYRHEQVRLGDLVRVIDREFTPELIVSARIVDIERDLLDPADTNVILGSFAPTIVEATINTARRIDDIANKPYNTKWLDGVIDVLQNAIENRQAYIWETPQGTLHMNGPTYEQATEAMLLGGGRFAIANQKDGQGGWNWRTFGDGAGFTADEINAGKIQAQFVQIGSGTEFDEGYDPALKNATYIQDDNPMDSWTEFASHLKDTWYSKTAQVAKILNSSETFFFEKGLGMGAVVNGHAGSSFRTLDSPVPISYFGIKGATAGVGYLELWELDSDFKCVEEIARGLRTYEDDGANYHCDIVLKANTNYAIIADVMDGHIATINGAGALDHPLVEGVLNRNFEGMPPPSVGTELTSTTEFEIRLGYYTWEEVENSLVEEWRSEGTTTIDGGKITANTITAAKLVADAAMVAFLNAQEITAGSVSADGITAGTLTLTANLNIESSDGNLEINGTQLRYTHADGTESRLGASGLRLYENGLLLPYISTVDAGMIDKFNETEGYWSQLTGSAAKKYFNMKRCGVRWNGQASNVKMLVTQGEELEWYDPSQYRHTGIKGMKYAVAEITDINPGALFRSNYIQSGTTASVIVLDWNADDRDGFYSNTYITIGGETRKIVRYDGSRAYVDEPFSFNPQQNDVFLIHAGPGGVNIQIESWYLAPWYSGDSGGEYYYPLTFGYMLILNN